MIFFVIFSVFARGNLIPNGLSCDGNLFFQRQGRIVNGSPAVPKSWPWIGTILKSNILLLFIKLIIIIMIIGILK